MKLLLFGTSNAILTGGYAQGLQDAIPHAEIVNRSVGASPGVQFAAYCNDSLADYDAVIFDSAVNDENFPNMIGTIEYMHAIMFEILSTIVAQTRLIVLGLTNFRHLGTESEIYKLHRRLALELGVQFFDGRKFVIEHQFALPETEAFYEAESHPNRILGRRLGVELGRCVLAPFKTVTAKSFAHRFISTDVADFCPGSTSYTKTNRLTSHTFLEMPFDRTIRLVEDYLMIGFYIDSSNTRGYLHVDKPESKVKRMLYFLDRPELLIKFVAMRNGSRSSSVRLGAKSDLFEDSPHCVETNDMSSVRISISRVVFWKGP